MDSAILYESILSSVQADLLQYGYSRSGKSAFFYRFSADKTVGCCIEMQKSMYNLPGSHSFTFNLLCVRSHEINGYSKDRLTVSALKNCLHVPLAAKRIGDICRSRDYWWDITEETLKAYDLKEYYDRFLRADIQACAVYLNGLADKPQQPACPRGGAR